ncbi:Protein CBG17772 [Caenorhabditis briggsae]|uniref:Protein CBG17772 n=1 Tax=Caenorhabditis briggsae TaxID=6238 RepID=A8XRR9_CAEBR|nr:Protein CBG17772 [Caenorhabditis briggsae]CAP35344.2 Protein CBG17772 [Caenorhabditis briggsae]
MGLNGNVKDMLTASNAKKGLTLGASIYNNPVGLAHPVNLVKNVVKDVIGPVGKVVIGVIGFFGGFFGGLFGGGGPSIPDILNPVIQRKEAFDKIVSGDIKGGLEQLKNFAGTQEEYKEMIDKFKGGGT